MKGKSMGIGIRKCLWLGVVLAPFLALSAAAGETLVVYAALNDPDILALQQAFKKDMGFEFECLKFGAGEGSARLLAEKNNPKADIFVGGSMEVYVPLKKAGVLVPYKSPEAAVIAAEYADPEGYWQGWYMGVQSIIYNKDRFAKELAPKGLNPPAKWDDLLDPAYKGLLVGSNPATAGGGYIFIADQIFRLGKDKAWNYVEKLNKNVSHYTKGAGDVISLVATGEFMASYAWAHDSYRIMSQGYPLGIVIPDDTAFEIGGAALIKGGPNSGNAKKFMDWLLSKKIGELNTKVSYRYSLRPDVAPPEGLPAIKDVKVVKYDRDAAAKMKEEVLDKFAEITGS